MHDFDVVTDGNVVERDDYDDGDFNEYPPIYAKFYKREEHAILPTLATPGSAGFDLHALNEGVVPARGRLLVSTGIGVHIIVPWIVGDVCSRSGLAAKHGIFALNAPGLIDSDYQGDIGVILANHSDQDFVFNQGDRIAQLRFVEHYGQYVGYTTAEEALAKRTKRGAGGFGSTGVSVQ